MSLRCFAFALLVLTIGACMPPPSSMFFRDASGRRLLEVDCYRRLSFCLEEAERRCQGEFRLLSREGTHDKMLAIVQCERDVRTDGGG